MRTIVKDILDVTEGIIVHQVNLQGVMNAGLAKQIRTKYPVVYQEYISKIKGGDVILGDLQFVTVSPSLRVVNMFSQDGYGGNKEHTNYLAMAWAFPIINEVAKLSEEEVYLPYKLGCGLGGGNWTKVQYLIEKFIPGAIVCKKA